MSLRRHVTSLVLVVLAVVLVVVAWKDRGAVTDSERQERSHDVFPAYRRSEIDAFELVLGKERGHEKVRLERRREPRAGGAAPGDGDPFWQMTSPVDERADPAAVDRFIGDLEFAGAIRKVPLPVNAEIEKGFLPENVRVRGTLSMKPLVYHFALGGPALVPEGAAYFRVDGEGTYVVSRDFVTALERGADAYRERTVVPYLSLDLAELDVKDGTRGFTITRVDDIAFKLTPLGLRASREGLDKVWSALAEARAESFLTDQAGADAVGLAPLRVLMTPKDRTKPKGELLLGGTCPGHPEDIVLVRVTPSRLSACVPRGALLGLEVSASALIDHRLFSARADEIDEVVFETEAPASPAFKVELARQGRGWHERAPVDRELTGTEVDTANDLLTSLTRGEATTVSTTAPAKEFNARARVRIHRGGSGVEEDVELGEGTESVRRGFDGAFLSVPSSLGRRLVPSEVALRGRAVFTEAGGAASPSGLRVHCDDVNEALTRSNDAWTMTTPQGFHADPLATADLVGLVRNAQAESWVADQDDGTFGLGEGRCTVEVDLASDGAVKPLGITFGKRAEGGAFYARATSGPAIFLAPRALREGTTTWLLDRSTFQVVPAAIERVTLGRGSAHLVLHEHASGDADVSDTTSPVLEALATLRPDTVVHLGPPRASEGLVPPVLDVRIALFGDGDAAIKRREVHFVLGNTATLGHERSVYARIDGIDATFGIAKDRVSALLGAL